MSFKPITVNTPSTDPAHILAQDDATLYHGIIGQDCVLDIGSKMEAVIIDNNTVRIRDGAVMVQGHLGRIPHGEYEDLHIENGVAGQKRHDLIVARFETTAGIDTYELAVIKGVSGAEGRDPDVTTGNLDKSDTLREYPLYRVKIDGLLLAEVEKVHDVCPTTGSHLAEVPTQFRSTVRNLSLTGDQVVDGFVEVPRALIVSAFVAGTTQRSLGYVDTTDQRGDAYFEQPGGFFSTTTAISLGVRSDHYASGDVVINNDKTVTIKWRQSAGTFDDTALIRLIAFYHGEGLQ